MDALAEGLSAQGWRCHAPCLPGHGADWEDLVRSHWRQWSEAAHAAYAALAVQGAEPPLIAGYSLGGLLALDTLAWAESRGLPAPRCLLVFAAPLSWASRPGRLGERAVRWRLAWKAWRQPVEICSPRSEAARTTAPWQGHERILCWRHLTEIAREQPRLRAILPRCAVPLCYAQLWHDSSCPRRNAVEWICTASRMAETHVLRTASRHGGHLPLAHRESRDEVVRIACAFVRKVLDT